MAFETLFSNLLVAIVHYAYHRPCLAAIVDCTHVVAATGSFVDLVRVAT